MGEYTPEDFINFIESGRFDKISNFGLELIAKKFRELESNEEIIEWLRDCPYTIDKATVPKLGISSAPEQVVGTLSLSYVKYTKLIDGSKGNTK